MEIYKLSDEVPGGKAGREGKSKIKRRGSTFNSTEEASRRGDAHGLTKEHKYDIIRDEDSDSRGLKITDIRQAVRDENRVNVYVNEKYAFSLDIQQVVELGVKVGQVISAEQLEEYKKASEFGKMYQRALEWVLMRPRSVKELRDYLRRRGRVAEAKEQKNDWAREREIAERIASGEDAEKLAQREMRRKAAKVDRVRYDFDDLIVERLVERGYVDDERFARYYVENRFVKKGVSQKRLRMELIQKGIAPEVIDEVLTGREDEEEIRKMIARKRMRYREDDKLIAYLCRQGFPYEMVRELVCESSETD